VKEGIVTSTTSSYSIRKDDGVEESHFGGVLYVPFGSVFTHEKNGEDENFPAVK
jgi:hypothetical protein